MSKSAKPLPIRQSDDGKWEVEMRGGKWVSCETEGDAKVLSGAPVLEGLWLKTRPLNKALAARLENTAEILKQYRIAGYRFFRAMTKLARGKQNGRK